MKIELSINDNVFGDLDYDSYPKMALVRQLFDTIQVENIAASISAEFNKADISRRILNGANIAVLVGSRGIANIKNIVWEVLNQLKGRGANPFIVPAMASHGGATAKGQADLLSSYDITKESMGVEIRSTMQPEYLGTTSDGVKVYFDVNALDADGVVPINRIKAHTAFRGDTESGLIKMIAIGAGKQKGAESYHSYGADKFGALLPEVFEMVSQHANILFGVGIVENAYEDTAIIEAIPAEKIYSREKDLLKLANQYMARLLVNDFDALIVGETGKNISGDGMDPNIMGRFAVPNMTGGARYQRMAVLDVTEESHGNAVGIGLADVIPQKLLKKADLNYMYTNAFTSKMVIPIAKIPLIAKDERDAIGVMLRSCVRVQKGKEKVVYIKNTLDLEKIWVSESIYKEIGNDPAFEILNEPKQMHFNAEGELVLV